MTAALYLAISRVGPTLSPEAALIGLLIASMPVAVSCGLFAERFEGDVPLAARAVFYSTLAALVTVPLGFPLLEALTRR